MMMRSLPLYLTFVFYIVTVNVGINIAQTNGDADAATDSSTSDAQMKQLDTIDAWLKTIPTELTSFDESKCLLRDILEAIWAQNYPLAEEKFNEVLYLAAKDQISNVVNYIYAKSSVNVDIILDFAKALSNNESQFLVFNALHNEMKSSWNIDPLKLIALVETMEIEQTKQSNEQLKAKFKEVIDNAVEDIKLVAASILMTAMVTDNYKKNVEIDNLTDAIFDFRDDVSNEVMERVVDGVFGVISADTILDNISSHKHIEQVITGLTAVFNKLNYYDNLNNDATLDLASHLQQMQQREDYADLGGEWKDEADWVIQQLPTCARNLFFHTYVCLWNKGNKQYLYAAPSTLNYDQERRSIYTWIPGDIKPGSYWNVQKIGYDFFFGNREHANEYMYAPHDYYLHDHYRRYVFTWIPGNNTDHQSAWRIELDGDYCYLKNTLFDEYLYYDGVMDKFNGFVFTWVSSAPFRGGNFQWQVRNCN